MDTVLSEAARVARPRSSPATPDEAPALASVPLTAADGAAPRRAGPRRATATMEETHRIVARLAQANVTVTLMAETGAGKDVLAHRLHAESPRRDAPFVVFDCGAVTETLAESELFGHERGAFTGAHAAHEGAFERAAGGTLFLDEIGELPLDLQPKLLRVLDSRRVRRVGGGRDRDVDVRIVAATNRDLAALVAARRFREDLYFRLAAAVVRIPPLRDRLDELPALVATLLRDLGRSDVQVTDEALAVLHAHPWPGNVRELKNVLACALAFLDGPRLEASHLCFAPGSDPHAALEALPLGGRSLESLERAAIEQTLRLTRGNKAMAAQVLGIAVSTLYEKLKRYQLAGG
jgi:DNA-binding NtrC family response regulator